MNYIYNVYLNFNKECYEFYEWKDTDEILHMKKIPIIKTNTNVFREIICNNIKISNEDFEQIKNKTECINRKYNNCMIITDSKNAYALKYDNNGNNEMISTFNLEDEYNILTTSRKLKETNINYKIKSKKKITIDTRQELEQKKYLLNIINKIPFDTIKYIYYDCFNKEENNYKLMIKYIVNKIHSNDMEICNKIYNILKPIYSN